MRRQEATEDGERERIFPHECFFFWFGLFWETNEGKRMTGRQLEMSCVSLSSPAARSACWHLALLTNSYYCAWMSTMSECVEHSLSTQGRAGECGAGAWFESPRCVSRGCFIRDHQQSGLIPPLILCLCFASFPFLTSTSCCLVVCTACCVMKGQSSGKRGSWHGNKVLHISTYLPALKASEVKLVSHSCEDEICERENVDSPSVAE